MHNSQLDYNLLTTNKIFSLHVVRFFVLLLLYETDERKLIGILFIFVNRSC